MLKTHVLIKLPSCSCLMGKNKSLRIPSSSCPPRTPQVVNCWSPALISTRRTPRAHGKQQDLRRVSRDNRLLLRRSAGHHPSRRATHAQPVHGPARRRSTAVWRAGRPHWSAPDSDGRRHDVRHCLLRSCRVQWPRHVPHVPCLPGTGRVGGIGCHLRHRARRLRRAPGRNDDAWPLVGYSTGTGVLVSLALARTRDEPGDAR